MSGTISKPIVAAAVLALVSTSPVAAAPANEIEITYYRTAAKTQEIGSRLLSCTGRVYRTGSTSRHTSRIVTPCNSSTPVPEGPSMPCEFKASGCGPFGRP